MYRISQAFFILTASSFNGNPDLTVQPFFVWKSSGIHARDLETQERPNGPIIHPLQVRQKAKPRRRVKGVIEDCKDGAGDWLVKNFELNKDSTCVNFQISLIDADQRDQVLQTGSSITAESMVLWTYPILARSFGGSTHKTVG